MTSITQDNRLPNVFLKIVLDKVECINYKAFQSHPVARNPMRFLVIVVRESKSVEAGPSDGISNGRMRVTLA